MRKRIWILFLIAFLFRLPGLCRPLIMDEPKAPAYAAMPFKALVNDLVMDSQPPFYYYCLKFWARISANPAFLRLFTVLLGSLICIILFKIVKRLYTEEAAYYSFIFAAISPQLIFQSQYLRAYCMGTFLSTLLVYIFLRFIQSKREKSGLAYFGLLGGVTALCLYSFYMSFFIIVALNIFAVYFLRNDREKLFIWLASQAAAAFLYSFWLPIFLAQKYLIDKGITCYSLDIDKARIGFYVGKLHVGNIIRIVLAYLHFDDIVGIGMRYSEHIKYISLVMTVFALSIVPAFLGIVRAVRTMFGMERVKGASALFLLLIAVPAAWFMIFSIGGDLGLWDHAVINIRYFSQSAIYALIVIALFLTGLRNATTKKALFSCIVIFFLALDVNIYQYPGGIYKDAADFLSDETRNCKTVVLAPPDALAFFDTLSDKRFSGYRLLKYNGAKNTADEVKRNIAGIDRLYFYYFKSAETMIHFPGIDSKFEKLAGEMGFYKKSEKKITDILIISYFARRK